MLDSLLGQSVQRGSQMDVFSGQDSGDRALWGGGGALDSLLGQAVQGVSEGGTFSVQGCYGLGARGQLLVYSTGPTSHSHISLLGQSVQGASEGDMFSG